MIFMALVIDPDRLGRHIAALTAHGPRAGDLPGVPAALRYISDELVQTGYEVRIERYGTELHEVNLITELPGVATDGVIELCAHWDSVAESPGADDNASGVAGVLETARTLRAAGGQRQTVRFCFFGGEEEDFGGSTFHVEQIAPHTSSIVLEMIAYTAAEQNVPGALDGLLDLPERGDFVALIANPDSAELIDLILGGADPELATFPLVAPVSFLPTVARSDHLPYWQTGHRSLLVTDTAEYRNPHYHQESDGLDQLDLGFAARVTEAVTRALAV